VNTELKDAREHQNIAPFKTRTGLEIISSSPETYPSLVQDMLLQVGVSMLCAKPKTGKSTFARQLSVCVAEGRDFFGKQTMQGDVLILNLEGPIGVLQQHLQKLGYTEKNGVIHIVHEQMPFRGDDGLKQLDATLEPLPKIRLVIVDPIAKFLRLADSDSYDEVSLGIEKLEQVAKKFNLHLMFLTHGKKRQTDDVGDSPIGSTGFRGGTDSNIFLNKQGARRVISTEQRWGTAMEPTLLVFDAERQVMELGNSVEEEQNSRHEAKDRETVLRIKSGIMDALCGTSCPTQQELLVAVKGKTTTILTVLNQLVGDGVVKEESEGRSRRYSVVVPCEKVAVVGAGEEAKVCGMDSFIETFETFRREGRP
jgi:hypothetical protein